MRDQRCVDERGVDPEKRRGFIGAVRGARCEGAGALRHDAGDRGVARAQTPRRRQGLIKRAENKREHDAESAMKAAYGIGEDLRMSRDGGGDPRVGELQKQGATRAKKYRSFAIDFPNRRLGAEHALTRSSCAGADEAEFIFEITVANH